MTGALRAAFTCHALAGLLLLGFGGVYLARSEFLPYHRDAIGRSWADLDPPLQALLLGAIKVAGGGFAAAGLGVLVLLLFPFRAGEPWARFAVPAVGLTAVLPTIYALIHVRRRTPARPPLTAGIFGAGLFVLGFALSVVG